MASTLIGHGTVRPLHVAAAATGASDSVRTVGINKGFQIIISNTATVDIQISNDNTNWKTIYTSTASEFVENSTPCRWVRTNITSYTSGTVDTNVSV